MFPAPPQEMTQVLLSEKEINELPDDSSYMLSNQILTGILIVQIHYLVVKV